MAIIIGRKEEQRELKRLYTSNEAKLVAVYGRRRVGKTYLIRETFENDFAFYHTGLSPLELEGKNLLKAQLEAFTNSLRRYGLAVKRQPRTWIAAFELLIQLIASKPKDERQVIFIDEMPWLDTPKSGFITAFENFWNGWASGQHQIMLIACGSAASWIMDNMINSSGGLYDRVDTEIALLPFTLHETEQMLDAKDIELSRYDIMEIYMAIGGIPYYLNQLKPGLSASEQIDYLFFAKNAKLSSEYDRLFNSTFANPGQIESVIRFLSGRRGGYSRDDISKKINVEGKALTKLLKSMTVSHFIEKYQPFGNSARQLQYRLIDHFCWFWLKQVDGTVRHEHFWRDNCASPSTRAWRGIAFEELCITHIPQIKGGLGISGVATEHSSWIVPHTEQQKGGQIDLILSRKDNMVHVCEMKCCDDAYQVDQEEDLKLRHRITLVREQVKKRNSIQPTLVTTFGLKTGKYSGIFKHVIILDDLFRV